PSLTPAPRGPTARPPGARPGAVCVSAHHDLEAARLNVVLLHRLLEVLEEPGTEDVAGVAERAGLAGDHRVGVHAVVERLSRVGDVLPAELRREQLGVFVEGEDPALELHDRSFKGKPSW